MKKTLFIIPLLAVVLTACTSSNKVTNFLSPATMSTYTNDRYGYSVQYPSNWVIYTEGAEEDYKIDYFGLNTGGNIYFMEEDHRNDPLVFGGIPPASLSLDIYKIPPGTTVEKFVTGREFEIESNKPVKINGHEAFKFTPSKDIHESSTSLLTIIKKSDKLYVFSSVGYTNGLDSTYQKIISSFTITQ